MANIVVKINKGLGKPDSADRFTAGTLAAKFSEALRLDPSKAVKLELVTAHQASSKYFIRVKNNRQ
jgi:predicted oxidoreductase